MNVLLDKKIGFYKAQLHTHTTISDGSNTPERVKQLYKAKGYSVVTFSDHEVLFNHEELKDESFLPITAYEGDVNQPLDFGPRVKSYHFNLFAKEANNVVSPVFATRKCWLKHMLNFVSEEQLKVDYDAPFSIEGANDFIKRANDAGFFVMLNHPSSWSLLEFDEFVNLEGLWGIEVYNNGSYLEGKEDSELPFSEMLIKGKNIFPLCTDDSHMDYEVGGSFTMIQSSKFDYSSIINALLVGDFYSSFGPEINYLAVDDEYLYLKCSKCSKVFISSDIRIYSLYRKGNHLFKETKINIKKFYDNNCRYIRLTLVDKIGRRAYTRAYYLDELKNGK